MKNLSKWYLYRFERFQQLAKSGRTYIFPTRLGFYVAAFCFVFLGMAYAYQNNLVYLYVFSVFGIFISAMAACNRNLQKLKIESISVNPFFSDLAGIAVISIRPMVTEAIRQVEVSIAKDLPITFQLVPPQVSTILEVPLPTYKRGIYKIPVAQFYSKHPFGFFRCWKVERPAGEFLVYPARDGLSQFPEGLETSKKDEGDLSRKGKQDDFVGHKPWNSSMSFRRLDWKVKARTGLLMVQSFEGGDQGPISFGWESTSFLGDPERKISQLSLWVDRAQLSGREFEMNFRGWNSGWGRGVDHAHVCWRYLSTRKEEDLR